MGLPFGAYEWQGALMLVLAVKAGKTGSSEKSHLTGPAGEPKGSGETSTLGNGPTHLQRR